MKRLALILMVSTLLLVGGPAFAELCTIDAVPAATLLLPYFEVDLNDANGVNTIFTINNASAAPALAHVTLWTDWSAPTIDFDVFLTGYDVQVVNLRDVFQTGNLPITADEASEGILGSVDTISPHGANPEWDGSFAGCTGFFPFYINPLVSGANFDRLVNGHTGQPVVGATCLGSDYGDGVARGYITVDSANACSTLFANESGYFVAGGAGIANNNNVLWGEYFRVDPGGDFAEAENLVHIEAEDGFTGGANLYTYYARYTGGTLADEREPLGQSWAARYFNNVIFTGGTDFTVWRDSTETVIADGYTCAANDATSGGPEWFPLNETEVVAFNEVEDAELLCFTGAGGVISPPAGADDPACFPLETQRIASTNLGFSNIGPTWESGWMYLNLSVGADTLTNDFDPFINTEGAQSYVSVSHTADGRYSVGLQAIELTSACDDDGSELTDVCDPTTTPPGACIIPFQN